MEKIIVSTDKAPKAIGPYSQAVRFNDFVFISGSLGIDPANGNLREGLDAQCEQSLDNMAAVLSSLGLDFSHVVKTTIFLKDMDDFSRVNEIYATRFKDAAPARSCVEVSRLPKRALVEIEAIAAYPSEQNP